MDIVRYFSFEAPDSLDMSETLLDGPSARDVHAYTFYHAFKGIGIDLSLPVLEHLARVEMAPLRHRTATLTVRRIIEDHHPGMDPWQIEKNTLKIFTLKREHYSRVRGSSASLLGIKDFTPPEIPPLFYR